MSSQFDLISDHSKERLKEIPREVLQITNLKMLFLEGNRLKSLPEDFFYRLPKLMWLDLRNNQINTIPRSVGYHKCLENLLLTNNRIQELPNELGLVPNLKVLQVADNPLVYPVRKIIRDGTKAIKRYLKQQYETNRPKTPIIFRTNTPDDHQREQNKADKEEEVVRIIDEYSRPSLTPSNKTDEIIQTESSNNFIARRDRSNKQMGSMSPREIYPRNDHRNQPNKQRKSPVTSVDRGVNYNSPPKYSDSKVHLQPTLRVKKLEPPTPAVKKSEEAVKIIHNIHKQGSRISLKSYFSSTGSKRKKVVERSLKEGWLNKLRILLEDQERILQQERNLKALTDWRTQQKKEAARSSGQSTNPSALKIDPPYATDPEYSKIPSRDELTHQLQAFLNQVELPRHRRSDTPILNIEKLLDDMEEQLREMQKAHGHNKDKYSPKSEVYEAEKQIQAIMEIHKKLLRLKAANDYS